MARVVVSVNEILDALALTAPGNAPEHARTAQELAVAAQVSRDVVNDRLEKLYREGRVVVHTVYRTNMTGRRIQVPAYTILPAKP